MSHFVSFSSNQAVEVKNLFLYAEDGEDRLLGFDLMIVVLVTDVAKGPDSLHFDSVQLQIAFVGCF